MQFTHFYAGNAVCAPSRCALMTGKHMGHATVRNNRQFKKGEEGQFPIRADDVTVAELLKAKGYATGAMGKWGLGMFDTTGSPMKHGFDLFYGYNCQAPRPQPLPEAPLPQRRRASSCKDNDGKTGKQYTQDLFETEALAFIETNKDKPFFLYLPFIVPHVAVQVPEDSLDEYKGKLGDDPAYDGKKGYLPHPTPRAALRRDGHAHGPHASAASSRSSRRCGLEKDTLVLFTSDNGPTHNVGGADSTFFNSAGTLRGLKGSLYEGGIRVPFIAYWPGTIKPGTTADRPLLLPRRAADALRRRRREGSRQDRRRQPLADAQRTRPAEARTSSSTGSSPATAASRR